MWTKYFLLAQGHFIRDNIVYQDNKSAMLLETNDIASSSKRTRHINILFFFVADRIKAGELRMEYCSTHEMVADFFSKHLQGSKFLAMRKIIINEV